MRHILLLVGLALLLSGTVPARSDELLVSAAASLTDVLEELGREYTKANPQTKVRFNCAASGVLQRQIEQGAPVDVFLSASSKEMDALQSAGRLETNTRFSFVTNTLVLIAPFGSKITNWQDLASNAVRRIALSSPETVPSGRYGKETLTKRKLWDAIQPKVVFGENVRQTLTYVVNGDADAGIVFKTDALQEKKRVKIVASAAETDHSPIVYPAAVVKQGPNPTAARRFLAFLKGEPAKKILTRSGFGIPTSIRARTTGGGVPVRSNARAGYRTYPAGQIKRLADAKSQPLGLCV